MSEILVSTAYLPPVEYFSQIAGTGTILIEKEENYIKQTYRNRCYILSAHGPQSLSVPVYRGSIHKTSVKDIKIDYSKRWQQVHTGAIRSSYGAAPFFMHYFEGLEKIINLGHSYLLDLNFDLLQLILNFLRLKKDISFTDHFTPEGSHPADFRYSIKPKKPASYQNQKTYFQVFEEMTGFVPQMSIIDLLFNMGPDSVNYL
jgi:hypothetical protein